MRLKTNVIAQYTVVSFLATMIIAVFLVLLMTGRVQRQLVLSRGDFYNEYVEAIPVNYEELLSYFGVSGSLQTPDAHPLHEDSENPEGDTDSWAHFRKDLSQYPYIQTVKIKNNKGDAIWYFPEAEIEDDYESTAAGNYIYYDESISYRIISRNPDFTIVYYISVFFEEQKIGTAEILIKDNHLQKILENSRTQFAILILIGGVVFYISLFILFFRVYSNQKKAITRLDKSQTLTIRTMSLLAELKDNDTGEHIQRTSEYCRILAESLSIDPDYSKYISEDYIKDLERSAPLHDIGKVGIPESILLKPGKLTADEFDVIKKHTELGARVLLSATESLEFRSYFEIGYQIALHHHENWDGSGYPHGLKGGDIPLSARIMAVADVYDALTTIRPYKRALSHEEAMEVIVKERASKFDPNLIDNLLRVEKEFKRISENNI